MPILHEDLSNEVLGWSSTLLSRFRSDFYPKMLLLIMPLVKVTYSTDSTYAIIRLLPLSGIPYETSETRRRPSDIYLFRIYYSRYSRSSLSSNTGSMFMAPRFTEFIAERPSPVFQSIKTSCVSVLSLFLWINSFRTYSLFKDAHSHALIYLPWQKFSLCYWIIQVGNIKKISTKEVDMVTLYTLVVLIHSYHDLRSTHHVFLRHFRISLDLITKIQLYVARMNRFTMRNRQHDITERNTNCWPRFPHPFTLKSYKCKIY